MNFQIARLAMLPLINNKNGNVWITGVEKIDKNGKTYYKPVPEINIDLNIKSLAKSIKLSNQKITRPHKFAMSINFGSIVGGKMGPEEIDSVIAGSSIGLQVCHIGCGGIMRTKGKDTIITYGLGTSQIGFSGGNMVRLDNNTKQQLFQILGIKK